MGSRIYKYVVQFTGVLKDTGKKHTGHTRERYLTREEAQTRARRIFYATRDKRKFSNISAKKIPKDYVWSEKKKKWVNN